MKNKGYPYQKLSGADGFLIAELLTALALLIVLCTAFMGLIGTITRQERATDRLLHAVTRIQSRYPNHELPEDFKYKVQPIHLPLPEGIDLHIHERVIQQTKPTLLSIAWHAGEKERTVSCIRCGDHV